MRKALLCLTVCLLACSRTGLELEGAIETGGTSSAGGATATGGASGGSGPTGGTSGAGAPGMPVQDCGLDPPDFAPDKPTRWLYLLANTGPGEIPSHYLVEITPNGPQNLTRVGVWGEDGSSGSWSSDGRFFSVMLGGGTPDFAVRILDVSRGGAAVEVPQRHGYIHWSPADPRYFSLSPANDPNVLSIVDATNGTEQLVPLVREIGYGSWSPDGRHIAFSGDRGVSIVDTLESELAVHSIHSLGTLRLDWSPGGRYLAFISGAVYVYDTQTERLEIARSPGFDEGATDARWLANDWLAWMSYASEEQAFFLDVTERPFAPIALDEQVSNDGVAADVGAPSPGSKCLAYWGFCQGSDERAICLRTLPPAPEGHPVAIERDVVWSPVWDGTGNHLFVSRPETSAYPGTSLLHIGLEGGVLSRAILVEGDGRVSTWGARWNPNGRSDWMAFVFNSEGGRRSDLHLWHRETRETHPIDIGPDKLKTFTWSPDGKYLLVATQTLAENDSGYLVQEVLDGELGWAARIDGVIPPLGGSGGFDDSSWQP